MKLDFNNEAFEHNEDLLRRIGEAISKIQAPLQKLEETARIANQALIATVQSQAVQNALQLGQEVAKTVAAFDFTPMLKKFSEAIIPLKYIYLLERLRWPLFLINDEELRTKILSECAVDEDSDVVRDIVFEYCDEDFFDALLVDWYDCPALKSERKSILSEAVQVHRKGFYYASVSTLMCQVYGIAADIDELARSNGLILDQEGKEFATEHFEIDIKYINNEKGRLLQSLMLTEAGLLLWDAMGDYIKNVTLYSGKDYSHIDNQPLRNKIGHGDQLNFGTQEHSLKAVLTIDMMVQLAYEINRIVELRKSNANGEENGCEEQKQDFDN